jgi:selenide,water dikinase
MSSETIRLTSLAACAGCAAKAGPGTLAAVLKPLIETFRPQDHPRLLAGVTDDAAVYQIDDETAVVQTIDFFPPVVDDPYTFGAVAAANAMSDVYAMGGEVVMALNVAAFPEGMAPETISQILRGGAETVAKAGGIIAGGHTVLDEEPKYGLSVMGLVHPQRIIAKTGAQPGDALVLTKALGTGLVLTAAKRDVVQPGHLEAAVASMLTLNRHASHLAREAGAHAMTDVTGFAIIGHSWEIADHSGVHLTLRASALPLLPGALGYSEAGLDFGGMGRNKAGLEHKTRIDPSLSDPMRHLLFDPQTSGGLLISLPPAAAETMVASLRADGYPAAIVGSVSEGSGVSVEA